MERQPRREQPNGSLPAETCSRSVVPQLAEVDARKFKHEKRRGHSRDLMLGNLDDGY